MVIQDGDDDDNVCEIKTWHIANNSAQNFN